MTNYKTLIDINAPDLPFFLKRKGVLKIDEFVKMP